MAAADTTSDIDLTGFWQDVDQINGEFDRRPELQRAGQFWTGFAQDLTNTDRVATQVSNGIATESAFSGQAASHFSDRLAAGSNAIARWLGQDIGSIGRQFGEYEAQVNTAHGYVQQAVATLAANGIADHQPTYPRPLFGTTRDITDQLELTRARRADLQGAVKDLSVRLAGVAPAAWSGAGSLPSTAGDAGFDQGVRVRPDVLPRFADQLTGVGTRPADTSGTVYLAHGLYGPLSTVADVPSTTASGAAITFQNQMHHGMTVAGDTLRGVTGHFVGQDKRSYQQIMQALG